MTLPAKRRWALLVGWVVIIAALIGTSLWAVSRPVAAQTGDEPTNGCYADVESAAVPDTVRICDPSDVQVVAAPTCPACPGGVHVVFIQREQATAGKWQGTAAMGALDKLEQLFGDEEGKLQAAVVHYGPGTVRTAVKMTDNMGQVRSSLNRARTVDNPPDHNAVGNAASREAIKQLKTAREDSEPIMPCEMVIFFAQDSPCPS
ncbi:MAG: hypothetical protein ACK2T6_03765 [Anaerolineae bacterium]